MRKEGSRGRRDIRTSFVLQIETNQISQEKGY
jgi:hypothetical protein